MTYKIGFIGQGWIGKNYADNFETRGFEVVRYSQEEPYKNSENEIKECDIVFIAVPTPTTVSGFDDSILRRVLPLVGQGKIAVIKSTILPGTTLSLQKENPGIFVFHSPEFLVETSAAYNAAHPDRNIIGIPVSDSVHEEKAKVVLSVLPEAPYTLICRAEEAEMIKYAGNNFLYWKVIYANIFYDACQALNLDYDVIKEALGKDPRIGPSHLNPIHQSGRGAGGHCFIKDFAAWRSLYEELKPEDEKGLELLKAMEEKNKELLISSGKDLELLTGVYGEREKLN